MQNLLSSITVAGYRSSYCFILKKFANCDLDQGTATERPQLVFVLLNQKLLRNYSENMVEQYNCLLMIMQLKQTYLYYQFVVKVSLSIRYVCRSQGKGTFICVPNWNTQVGVYEQRQTEMQQTRNYTTNNIKHCLHHILPHTSNYLDIIYVTRKNLI